MQGEWQGLVARRMQYLGHVQSDYILSAADAALGICRRGVGCCGAGRLAPGGAVGPGRVGHEISPTRRIVPAAAIALMFVWL